MDEARNLLSIAARLAERLTPGDLDHTLRAITDAAVELIPGADAASITVLDQDGSLQEFAETDPILTKLDAAQYEFREGPCYEAALEQSFIRSPHLAADERYPRYAPVAVAAGFKSQAGLRLFDTPNKAQGALNLYSHSVGAFTDVESIAPLFAHQATVALRYAYEVENLETALASRKVIGQAIGVAMERYGLTEAQAFALLTRLSQSENVKLRFIAERIVNETEGSNGDPAAPRDEA